MKQLVLAVLATSCLAWSSEQGTYNQVLKPGDTAPSWQDLPGTDGMKHSSADFKDKEILIVVFTCCSCPIAEDYQDRIIAFTKKYTTGPLSKVALVAINANNIPEDRLPKMKERAAEKGFTFPFLHDETQKTARAFGAEYTPEFFVLNKDRKIVYMGALDDRNNAASATVNYLEPAVEAALKGVNPMITETIGRGCRIRYERVKK